jgi:hypothetical protein
MTKENPKRRTKSSNKTRIKLCLLNLIELCYKQLKIPSLEPRAWLRER